MDLNKLEHFLAVAEELSFTRAAARLHLAQSGVSSSVKYLERDLGVPLFDRTTQKVELTDAGQVLVTEARRVLAAVRDARQAVDEVRSGLRGTLELGVLHGLTPTHVPATLAAFRTEFPLVDIHLVAPGPSGATGHTESLREGALDLAYLMVAGPTPDLRVHVLSTETLVLACAADHPLVTGPLAGRAGVVLADLADADFIDFPPGWGIRGAVDRVFAAAGLPPRRTSLEMTEISTVLDLVRHRLGVAFVPESFRDQAPDLRFLSILDHTPGYGVAIAADAVRPLGPVARAFLDTVLGRHPAADPAGPPSPNDPVGPAKPTGSSAPTQPAELAGRASATAPRTALRDHSRARPHPRSQALT
ncbi:MAG TPA: LysR substrate-binding domain-containing protein [Actinocrinis sp.]|nr:LysR substrate-binding domain-containing protein [Actinocrinis sp.]